MPRKTFLGTTLRRGPSRVGAAPGRCRPTCPSGAVTAWLTAPWVTRVASPGCWCTAAPAAVASRACSRRWTWRASGRSHPISGAAGPVVPEGKPPPAPPMRWWPIWRRCGGIWASSAGRCWRGRGARWWRWPMRRHTRSGCSAWCCAARSRSPGARWVVCCSRLARCGKPSAARPPGPQHRVCHCPRRWPG